MRPTETTDLREMIESLHYGDRIRLTSELGSSVIGQVLWTEDWTEEEEGEVVVWTSIEYEVIEFEDEIDENRLDRVEYPQGIYDYRQHATLRNGEPSGRLNIGMLKREQSSGREAADEFGCLGDFAGIERVDE